MCLAFWQVLLTWRLMEQDRNLAIQQSREHLEQVADLAVSQIARALGEWELSLRQLEKLPPASHMAANLSPGTQLVLVELHSVETYPRRPILFVPSPVPGVPLPSAFDTAEKLEFRDKNYQQTIYALQPLAERPATRAEALLRIARLDRRLNHLQSALANYDQLSQETAISLDGVPYALLALGARAELLPYNRATQQLRAALLAGYWPLHRETFEFYWTEVNWLEHTNEDPPKDSMDLSLLVSRLYDQWRPSVRVAESFDTREIAPDQSLLLWHATPLRLTVLSAPAGWLKDVVKLPASARDIGWRWVLTASPSSASAGNVIRSLAEAQLAGKLEFSSGASDANRTLNRPMWISGVALMLSLVLAGAYAMYRGVSRELRVAQLQSDFVAAVSHEFRSPLTSLRGITELLSDGRIAEPSRQRQSYMILERETGRLQRLVEDLLDFGRMESGKKQYKKEPHDAFEIVRAAVEEFQKEAHAQGFAIDVHLASCDSTIEADQEALMRAIRNLLENAVKYSQDSHTVWVEGRVTQSQVAISVRDQGIGIAPEEHREIFQKFVRGTAAKTAGIKGTGIGLSMVRQIIQASGGEIHLESAPGSGSTFTILLPLAQKAGAKI